MSQRRRLRRLTADLAALGPTAPVRAAYEVSKRVGGHRLAFAVRTSAAPPLVRLPLQHHRPSPPAVGRARDDARTVNAGSRVLFGALTAASPDWHADPVHQRRWAVLEWWKIDIRSDARLGDVKWTWELGRHRHLLVLARAAREGDQTSADLLVAQLRSWVEQNPPEVGIHWYSNLEIALRALVWLQVLDLVGDRLPEDLRAEMHRHLFHSGRHLLVDLPYTVSSMRNNHMLGDALGLMALGKAFARPRWWRVGHRLFEGQLARHMRSDGSMIEDSLSYHRFVLEMLAVRVLLGDAPDTVQNALRSSGEHLARLGVFAGPVPQYGDWDEGRVLGSSQDPLDCAGSTALALALSGTGAPATWREDHDECAWYASEGEPAAAPPAETEGRALGGGFARAERGGWTSWLKAGGGTSHQHADLCSTVLCVDGQWVVGDPGTGTYNGPLEQRNAFRTSGAHSVLRLDGTDQLGPHRAFRWLHKAEGVVGPALSLGDAVVMWGVHDAYRRLPVGGRVARLVVHRDGASTVADVFDGPAGRRWDLTLPLHPDVTYEDQVLTLPDRTRLKVLLPGAAHAVRGSQDPYEGWWSHTYGSAVPATWLRLHGTTGAAVAWAVHREDVAPAVALRDGLRVGEVSLRLSFSDRGAELAVHDAADRVQQVLYAGLPR